MPLWMQNSIHAAKINDYFFINDVRTVSKGLCMYIITLDKYDRVLKKVLFKKEEHTEGVLDAL